MASDQETQVCKVCNFSKLSSDFRKYNKFYTHKTCSNCEDAIYAMTLNPDVVQAISQPKVTKGKIRALGKTCEGCSITKSTHDFPVGPGGNSDRYCRACRLVCVSIFQQKLRDAESLQVHLTEPAAPAEVIAEPPPSQKMCKGCREFKSTNEFYRQGNYILSKCKQCHKQFKKRPRVESKSESENAIMEIAALPKTQDVMPIISEIAAPYSPNNSPNIASAIEQPQPSIEQSQSPILTESNCDDAKFVLESGDDIPLGDAQLVLDIMKSASNVVSDARPQKKIAQNSRKKIAASMPIGLEKFDYPDLLAMIPKVLYVNILGLKCFFSKEDISELEVWRTQVKELYARQNVGCDEQYRRAMFDFRVAAYDLKNMYMLRCAASATL